MKDTELISINNQGANWELFRNLNNRDNTKRSQMNGGEFERDSN
mgnify:CR=1 FL=1